MRRLTDLYPEFSREVELLAVDMDLGESVQDLKRFRERQGYPFQLATTDAATLIAYHYVGQSSKFGVDRSGVIAYRAGYGQGNDDEWRALFRRLAE